jgi:signal transduction histidine kinase
LIGYDRRHVYALAFVYSALIVILVSIPAYFYVAVEKENYAQAQQQKLEQYAYGLEKSIYDFSRTGKRIYDFPRSVVYGAHLFDAEGKPIFATDRCGRGLEDFESGGLLAKRITLNANRLGAKYLTVAQPFSYRAIYIRVLMGALFLGIAVFLMSLFFIRISLRPLERANRYLNIFFNDAMHELKTPLGVMQLNLEMLQTHSESKPLQRLRNSMHNLIMIYEDIEYHIKHDHVAYRPERIDFSRFLGERVDLFRTLAHVKSIAIEEAVMPEIFVWMNRIELQRIIDNTLSNAIKYSERETVVRVRLGKEENQICFGVTDEGVGIANTLTVFDRYHRENTVQGGFGLGLSIVRHICDKNHVEIQLESQEGKGSAFRYCFDVLE